MGNLAKLSAQSEILNKLTVSEENIKTENKFDVNGDKKTEAYLQPTIQDKTFHLEQNRKSSKVGQDRESDIYFCLFFGWYCQSLLSGMQGGQ